MREKVSVLKGLLSIPVACKYYHMYMYVVYRTFSDTSDPEELQRKCRELCVHLGENVEEEGVMVMNV